MKKSFKGPGTVKGWAVIFAVVAAGLLVFVQYRQRQRIAQLWLELDAQRAWVRSVEQRLPEVEVSIDGARTEARRVR